MENIKARPDLVATFNSRMMLTEVYNRLRAAGISVPDECVSFDILADPGEIVSVTWRCHATRDLLNALGDG